VVSNLPHYIYPSVYEMDAIASLYPPLEARTPLPVWLHPSAFLTTLIPFFLLSQYKYTRTALGLTIFLYLAHLRPYYTLDDPSGDYNTATSFFPWCIQFIDFSLLAPLEGEPARYVGSRTPKDRNDGIIEDDCTTLWQRFIWALRLNTTPRGVGWNWRVKGVPSHPDASLAKWPFIRKSLLKVLYHTTLQQLTIIALGFSQYLQEQSTSTSTSPLLHTSSNIAIAWSIVIYVWHGLQMIYSLAAAATVGINLCSPWEWPPILDRVGEGWSVRHMWSAAYHQIIRRNFQRPGQRLVRLLGLKKGSLSSKYLQLYLAFFISMILHEWNIFNVTRRDGGEFWFFMSQPFAITAEDFLIWVYEEVFGEVKKPSPALRMIGYLWVFVWFSYSLPPFIQGLLDAGIMPGQPFERQSALRAKGWAESMFG
jgi:hypothetical protein